MREGIKLMNEGRINPATMITYVGGLDSAAQTTMSLNKMPGGKKLIYNQISMPMTAISDFAKLGETDPMFKKLAELVAAHNGLWNGDAEKYLLAHAKPIE